MIPLADAEREIDLQIFRGEQLLRRSESLKIDEFQSEA